MGACCSSMRVQHYALVPADKLIRSSARAGAPAPRALATGSPAQRQIHGREPEGWRDATRGRDRGTAVPETDNRQRAINVFQLETGGA